MNIKKIIISIIAIFLLSVVIHSMYNWFPNKIVALFFPVNESIWEHNKMIVTTFIIWSIIEKIIYKNSSILYNIISAIICCILVTTVFGFVYFFILKTKDNIFVALSIYFIAIVISQIINYLVLNKKIYKDELLGVFISIILIIINAFLTFNPIHNDLFYDFKYNHYGIKK